eukprot:TRINITY_DN64619_c0_g1_i1.p1 TRINITY_DN64619_c0_g1~~TRINITY_DN64619_c0_g1_i1.p1  ORF type:complete len:1028 (-),score=64.91 TRINITY_DN64619_c0_g1_i1:921-4004(-)
MIVSLVASLLLICISTSTAATCPECKSGRCITSQYSGNRCLCERKVDLLGAMGPPQYGTNCTLTTPELCPNSACRNGGICVDNACQCPRGYSGPDCSVYQPDPCAQHYDCNGHGDCVLEKNLGVETNLESMCTCDARHTGPTCNVATHDDCKQCKNGGSCYWREDSDGKPLDPPTGCKCPVGYGGQRCEKRLSFAGVQRFIAWADLLGNEKCREVVFQDIMPKCTPFLDANGSFSSKLSFQQQIELCTEGSCVHAILERKSDIINRCQKHVAVTLLKYTLQCIQRKTTPSIEEATPFCHKEFHEYEETDPFVGLLQQVRLTLDMRPFPLYTVSEICDEKNNPCLASILQGYAEITGLISATDDTVSADAKEAAALIKIHHGICATPCSVKFLSDFFLNPVVYLSDYQLFTSSAKYCRQECFMSGLAWWGSLQEFVPAAKQDNFTIVKYWKEGALQYMCTYADDRYCLADAVSKVKPIDRYSIECDQLKSYNQESCCASVLVDYTTSTTSGDVSHKTRCEDTQPFCEGARVNTTSRSISGAVRIAWDDRFRAEGEALAKALAAAVTADLQEELGIYRITSVAFSSGSKSSSTLFTAKLAGTSIYHLNAAEQRFLQKKDSLLFQHVTQLVSSYANDTYPERMVPISGVNLNQLPAAPATPSSAPSTPSVPTAPTPSSSSTPPSPSPTPSAPSPTLPSIYKSETEICPPSHPWRLGTIAISSSHTVDLIQHTNGDWAPDKDCTITEFDDPLTITYCNKHWRGTTAIADVTSIPGFRRTGQQKELVLPFRRFPLGTISCASGGAKKQERPLKVYNCCTKDEEAWEQKDPAIREHCPAPTKVIGTFVKGGVLRLPMYNYGDFFSHDGTSKRWSPPKGCQLPGSWNPLAVCNQMWPNATRAVKLDTRKPVVSFMEKDCVPTDSVPQLAAEHYICCSGHYFDPKEHEDFMTAYGKLLAPLILASIGILAFVVTVCLCARRKRKGRQLMEAQQMQNKLGNKTVEPTGQQKPANVDTGDYGEESYWPTYDHNEMLD